MFSPQLCEVVSEDIIPIIIQLQKLRLERLSGLSQSRPAKKVWSQVSRFLDSKSSALPPVQSVTGRQLNALPMIIYVLSVGDGTRSLICECGALSPHQLAKPVCSE